jgi:hypothetical protein
MATHTTPFRGVSAKYPELARFDDDPTPDDERDPDPDPDPETEHVLDAELDAEEAAVEETGEAAERGSREAEAETEELLEEPSASHRLNYRLVTDEPTYRAAVAFAAGHGIPLPPPSLGILAIAEEDGPGGEIHGVWAVQIRIDAQPLVTSRQPRWQVNLLRMLGLVEAALTSLIPAGAGLAYHVDVAQDHPTGDQLARILPRCGFVEYPPQRTFVKAIMRPGEVVKEND